MIMGAMAMGAMAMAAMAMAAEAMVAEAMVAAGQMPKNETAISTVTVRSEPGSPIPAIISHEHQAGELATPGNPITHPRAAARNRNMPDKTRSAKTRQVR
jgi:hypothetical protein